MVLKTKMPELDKDALWYLILSKDDIDRCMLGAERRLTSRISVLPFCIGYAVHEAAARHRMSARHDTVDSLILNAKLEENIAGQVTGSSLELALISTNRSVDSIG